MPSPLVRLQSVEKRFGNGTLALDQLTLELGADEFVSLIGPSGCGKSTVLRLIAGLEPFGAGVIEAPALSGRAAETAFVFQEPTLMPWASVYDNVWLPLRLRQVSRRAADERVQTALRSVGLGDFEHSLPAQLSGGMKMRASIARALITQPSVLLMDEPFAALDEITRQKLNLDLLHWWQARPLAVLFVTHSVFEAVFLSQRVLVMSGRPGQVVADIAIDEPHPRDPRFRMSAHYAQLCVRLSEALADAHADRREASG